MRGVSKLGEANRKDGDLPYRPTVGRKDTVFAIDGRGLNRGCYRQLRTRLS